MRAVKEIGIMAPLSHPNLVKLYGGCWNEGADKLCIVLEFCARGDLLGVHAHRLHDELLDVARVDRELLESLVAAAGLAGIATFTAIAEARRRVAAKVPVPKEQRSHDRRKR